MADMDSTHFIYVAQLLAAKLLPILIVSSWSLNMQWRAILVHLSMVRTTHRKGKYATPSFRDDY